jgi:hypothetical protein
MSVAEIAMRTGMDWHAHKQISTREGKTEMQVYLQLGHLADEMESVNFAQGPVYQVYFHPFKYFAALLMDSDVPSSENQFLNA